MSRMRWLKLLVLLGSLALGYYIGVSSAPRSGRARNAAIGYAWSSVKIAYRSKQPAAVKQAAERLLAVVKQSPPGDASLQGLAILATVAESAVDEPSSDESNSDSARLWKQATTLCEQAHWKACAESDLRTIAATALGGGT